MSAAELREQDRVARGKLLLRIRNRIVLISTEDEGDRVYFASTNDADEFKEIKQALDDWHWDEVIREGKLPDLIEDCRKANERAAAAREEATSLQRQLEAARAALASVPIIAEEIRLKWDEGMRAGKLLIALIEPSLKYRADTTAIHAAIAKPDGQQ